MFPETGSLVLHRPSKSALLFDVIHTSISIASTNSHTSEHLHFHYSNHRQSNQSNLKSVRSFPQSSSPPLTKLPVSKNSCSPPGLHHCENFSPLAPLFNINLVNENLSKKGEEERKLTEITLITKALHKKISLTESNETIITKITESLLSLSSPELLELLHDVPKFDARIKQEKYTPQPITIGGFPSKEPCDLRRRFLRRWRQRNNPILSQPRITSSNRKKEVGPVRQRHWWHLQY